MMAGVGSSTKVMGIKIAVAAEGPMPGKTPIKRAEEAAEQREEEVHRLERGGEPVQQ